MNKSLSQLLNAVSDNWKLRHILVILVAVAGTWAFLLSRMEWSEMHRWNRATGDMSLIMVAIAMSLGPLSRLSNRFRWTVPFRRELGIYGVLLAGIHIAIILAAWVEWDLVRLFGYEIHPTLGRYVMVQHGFGLANAIGIVAVIYAIALALSSNDWSQKKLGAMVWKFFQQSAYVYWMLIVVHTAYFLYLHFQDFHRRTPDPNWAQLPFVILVVLVLGLQTAAFIKTWKLSSRSA
jgi:sulfoxide reductase heme-binding subunit YedZ